MREVRRLAAHAVDVARRDLRRIEERLLRRAVVAPLVVGATARSSTKKTSTFVQSMPGSCGELRVGLPAAVSRPESAIVALPRLVIASWIAFAIRADASRATSSADSAPR